MPRLFFFMALFCGMMYHATAQSKFFRGSVGFQTGTIQYRGELGNDFYRFGTINPLSGISYTHYASDLVDLSLSLTMGSWGFTHDQLNSFDTDILQLGLDLKLKLNRKDDPRWLPYLLGGMGIQHYANWTLFDVNGDVVSIDQHGNPILPSQLNGSQSQSMLGGGLRYRFAERVYITLEERFAFPGLDVSDGFVADLPDGMLMHRVGLSFGLFPWCDTDGDKVSDKDDKCPDTPSIAQVDENGCPLDTDLDGVADYEDNCISIPGHASGLGCPDRDGDAVLDETDQCPDVIGLISLAGCPDADGDQITDSEDECPELAGSMNLKGCPDKDGDGVSDKHDVCSATPIGIAVNTDGCPLDKDADGIADYLDKCPDDAGTLSNIGCPEVKEEVKAIFTAALHGIQFESGKETIRKTSYSILDSIVKVMDENPLYKLRISGHTDNSGDSLRNVELSDKRAQSIQLYLIDHGVPTARIISAQGYGSSRPIADNATREGKALNRRVEFEVEY